MESERFKQALGRLEAAIDRLDKIAHVPTADARLAALEQRHGKLRAGASDALTRLDRLIDAAAAPATEA